MVMKKRCCAQARPDTDVGAAKKGKSRTTPNPYNSMDEQTGHRGGGFMAAALIARFRLYRALAALVSREVMAYSLSIWVTIFAQILAMVIAVAFWRAIYAAGSPTVAGMTERATIQYMLLGQMLAPMIRQTLIGQFGSIIREGYLAIELLRPVDFQERFLVKEMAGLLLLFCLQTLPMGVAAWLLFDLHLPSDPRVWAAFALSLLLGKGVLFFFDWLFCSLAFYTTETGGLYFLREAVAALFSGALVPVAMFSGWMQAVARALPFSQALHVPVSILTGAISPAQVLQAWAIQATWLVGLWALSRAAFGRAL